MNILLVEPPYELYSFNAGTIALFEPLGLETIAGAVPEKHEIRLIDLRIEKREKDLLSGFTPDICAFACHSYATMPATLKTMQRYRKMFPQALFVAGGHASLTPEHFSRQYADAVVIGDGEETFRELIAAWETGTDISDVKGLAVPQHEGGMFMTGERHHTREMSDYTHPRRDLTERYRSRYFRYDWRPMAAMVTSRGCPHRCDYCSIWKLNRGQFRMRTAEDIADELEKIQEKYVTIVDDNTLVNEERIWKLIDLVRERGIRKIYSIYARTDTIAKKPDLMKALASIGVKRVLAGVDGFRDEDLKDRNKKNSVANNDKAAAVLKSLDIQTIGYFLIRPDYTEKDFEALASYVKKMDIFQPIFTMLTPLPGTELYERVRDRLTTHDPRMYDFLHMVLPTEIPLSRFYRCYTRLWRTSHKRSLLSIRPAAIRSYMVFRRLYKDHLRPLAENTFQEIGQLQEA